MADLTTVLELIGVDAGGSRAAREVASALDGVTGSAGRTNAALAATATAIGAVVVAAGAITAATTVIGVSFNAQKEQATIAFTTMMKDADAAKQHIKDLTDFAARTPFNLSGLIQTSQRLQALGFEGKAVIPILQSIGNAAASGILPLQEGIDRISLALGQMNAKGKASGEEMRQLSEAGINALRYISEGLGKTQLETSKMIESGAVSSATAIHYILAGVERDFGGLMEKQSHSFNGLMSNLQDFIQRLAGTVTMPIFDRLKTSLEGATAALSSPEFEAGAEKMAMVIDVVLTGIGRVVEAAKGPLAEAFGTVVDIASKIFAGDVGGATERILGVVGGWIRTIGGWVAAGWELLSKGLDWLGQQLTGWVNDQAGELQRQFREEWLPAVTSWLENDAPTAIRTALDKAMGDLDTWSKSDGVKEAKVVGGTLATAIVDGVKDALKQEWEGSFTKWLADQIATTWQGSFTKWVLDQIGGHGPAGALGDAAGLGPVAGGAVAGGTWPTATGPVLGPPVPPGFTFPTPEGVTPGAAEQERDDYSRSGRRFSPFDEIFRRYAPANLADNEEFINAMATGAKAESQFNAGSTSGDSGHSWGLFQIHDINRRSAEQRGFGWADRGAWRLDPDAATRFMMPRYVAAWQGAQGLGLQGADLAARVAAYAENPEDFENPRGVARNNYRRAFNEIAAGQTGGPPPASASGGGTGTPIGGVVEEIIDGFGRLVTAVTTDVAPHVGGGGGGEIAPGSSMFTPSPGPDPLNAQRFLESFRGFNLANQIGDEGAKVMDALKKAIDAGTDKNVEALGKTAAAMIGNLYDKAPPEAAAAWIDQIMDAITAAADERTPEAQQHVEDLFASINFNLPLAKLGDEMATRINIATDQAIEQITDITKKTSDQVALMFEERDQSRTDRRARFDFSNAQKLALDAETESIRKEQEAWRDMREDQARTRAIQREDEDRDRTRAAADAETVISRARQERDARRAQQGQGTRQAGQAGGMEIINAASGGSIDEMRRQFREQDQDLARRRGLENTEIARRRQQQAEDLVADRGRRDEDEIERQRIADRLDSYRRNQANDLQNFEDRLADAALTRQVTRLETQRDEAIGKANERMATIEAGEITKWNAAMARQQLLNDLAARFGQPGDTTEGNNPSGSPWSRQTNQPPAPAPTPPGQSVEITSKPAADNLQATVAPGAVVFNNPVIVGPEGASQVVDVFTQNLSAQVKTAQMAGV